MLIPMAGEGCRFKDKGYNLPKPLLDIGGKPMIVRVIENFQDPRFNFIFCVQQSHITNHHIDKILKSVAPNSSIFVVDRPTQGPVCTCLLAEKLIDTDIPLIITNSDQIIEDWNLDNFIEFCNTSSCDGAVGTFESQSPKNSYIQLNENGYGVRLREKEVISEHATNGLHYWHHGKYFVSSAREMMNCGDTTNNEYYVAPTYNYMIKKGMKISSFKFNKHYPIGIPVDYENYITRLNNNANIL